MNVAARIRKGRRRIPRRRAWRPAETGKDEKETKMRKTLFAIAAVAVLAASSAWALQFPESCVSPPATVTRITGVNTRNARMEARYTMPDIIQACNEGYVDQANAPPALCIKRHRTLINAAPLHAHADCVARHMAAKSRVRK